MLFKFKSKPIYIDFFTNSYHTKELFDISRASLHKPQWWKDIEKKHSDVGIPMRTAKGCAGFLDYFKLSYVVPLPYELYVVIQDREYQLITPDYDNVTEDVFNSHPPYQRGNFLPEERYSHIKLPTKWVVDSNKSIPSLITPPCWSNELFVDKISVLSAARNFKYSSSTHWHFILNKNENVSFTLDAGTPCYHFTPITDRKVVVRSHYDPDKFKKITEQKDYDWSFSKSYLKYMSNLRKKINGLNIILHNA